MTINGDPTGGSPGQDRPRDNVSELIDGHRAASAEYVEAVITRNYGRKQVADENCAAIRNRIRSLRGGGTLHSDLHMEQVYAASLAVALTAPSDEADRLAGALEWLPVYRARVDAARGHTPALEPIDPFRCPHDAAAIRGYSPEPGRQGRWDPVGELDEDLSAAATYTAIGVCEQCSCYVVTTATHVVDSGAPGWNSPWALLTRRRTDGDRSLVEPWRAS